MLLRTRVTTYKEYDIPAIEAFMLAHGLAQNVQKVPDLTGDFVLVEDDPCWRGEYLESVRLLQEKYEAKCFIEVN